MSNFDSQKLNFIATAAFGLEGIVSKELKYLGYESKAELGGARFSGRIEDALIANINLRCADRVNIILAEEIVKSFEELFQLVLSIQWEKILTNDAKILVSGKCVRSQLMSVRDCQAISKKSIIKRLKNNTNKTNFPETGEDYSIDVSIHNDLARISLNTSGMALNKRGYRTWNGDAPIRETLAAAMLNISPWRMRQTLYDPCCGSGTFLIEAAMMALNKPAGMERNFAMEKWTIISSEAIDTIRQESIEKYKPERECSIMGSDIDEQAITLCKKHIVQANLSNRIKVVKEDLANLQLDCEPGCFVVNPPYGERLSDKKECTKLYHELGRLLQRHPGWTMAVIANDPEFEKKFGRRAKKKRRVYNGRLECNIYMFF